MSTKRPKSTDVTRDSRFDKFDYSQVTDLMATALMLREAVQQKNLPLKASEREVQQTLIGLSFLAELLWQSCNDEQIKRLGLAADSGMVGWMQKDGHAIFIAAFVEVVDWNDPEAIKHANLEETLAQVLEVCESQWAPEKHKLLKEVWFTVADRAVPFEAYEAHMSEHFDWTPNGFRADYFWVKDYSVTTALPRLREEMAATKEVVTSAAEDASYAHHTNPDGTVGGLVHAEASVDPLAYVHESARIEAGAEIGADVRIEAGAQIAAGAKIQKDSWFATFQVPGIDRPLTAVWTPDPEDDGHVDISDIKPMDYSPDEPDDWDDEPDYSSSPAP